MNELKDTKKKRQIQVTWLINDGVNTKNYNQGPWLKLNGEI